MMKKKSGFTLMEVMLALAMFTTASVIIFSVFITNHMRIEAQGKETFLHEEIDRGITRLSDRLKGTCEILKFENADNLDFSKIDQSDVVLLRFKYYYRDAEDTFTGKLYLVKENEKNILKLDSTKDSNTKINTLMGYLDKFEVVLLNSSGNKVGCDEVATKNEVIEEKQVCAVKLIYKVSTKYRKIQKEKEGEVVVKLRNIDG